MTKVPIQIYLDENKKTEWNKYADDHGMSLTQLIKNSVDFFISNSDKVHESAPVISNQDIQETKEIVKMLSAKLDSFPTMMQQVLLENAENFNRGATFQALIHQAPVKDRIASILEANKRKVTTVDMLKASIPDISGDILYNTLSELVDEGKAERTIKGWRKI